VRVLTMTDTAPVVITGITPGLTIRQSGGAMVAHWLCSCGHHERAVGGAQVARLTECVTVGVCPHQGGAVPAAPDRPDRPVAPVVDLAAHRARRTRTGAAPTNSKKRNR
jgi:hypothetical protein